MACTSHSSLQKGGRQDLPGRLLHERLELMTSFQSMFAGHAMMQPMILTTGPHPLRNQDYNKDHSLQEPGRSMMMTVGATKLSDLLEIHSKRAHSKAQPWQRRHHSPELRGLTSSLWMQRQRRTCRLEAWSPRSPPWRIAYASTAKMRSAKIGKAHV